VVELIIRDRKRNRIMNKLRKLDKVSRVQAAWETLAPNASFGGMTLEQFKAQVKPSFDSRTKLSTLDHESTETIKNREDADRLSTSLALLVVNAVKGDPQHGADSPLYSTMGYVRKSDRKSGLKRRTAQSDAVPLQKAA
jgi:hypothetical protein